MAGGLIGKAAKLAKGKKKKPPNKKTRKAKQADRKELNRSYDLPKGKTFMGSTTGRKAKPVTKKLRGKKQKRAKSIAESEKESLRKRMKDVEYDEWVMRGARNES